MVRWLWNSRKPVRLASASPTVIFPTAGGPTTKMSIGEVADVVMMQPNV